MVGYVNFVSVPRSSRKGKIHISMLAFEKSSYAGFGMFVGDAEALLENAVHWRILVLFLLQRCLAALVEVAV